ncbi:MAG TPA: ATP-binding protein [Thermoanaerobaculia bacterium]|jgi:predicted ATPase|nr:ATP-binding protein [Thermoanaerobaculia bacterium]
MITLVEALNYRCLRYISQPLGPFHVLVGPNSSGKTTFLDVIAFLGRLVSDGPDAAIEERTQNFYDLVWQRDGTQFELAIEARIPDELLGSLRDKRIDTVRYEVALSIDPATQERGLRFERVLLQAAPKGPARSQGQRPGIVKIPKEIITEEDLTLEQGVIIKGPYEAVRSEVLPGNTWDWFAIELGPRKSTLRNVPDSVHFPVSLWLREMLTSGVRQIVLNSLLIRHPSPPGKGLGLRPDGSNLPWVIADFRQRSPERFRQWIAHLRTAFPDLEDMDTIERPEDRHRYLVLQYGGDLKVPSWMASDGTLRMLALTLPAYLEDFKGIYLIEEPENGIHPRAIETMTQSLSSVYNAQVLMATHSPVVLSTVEAEQILCFSKNAEGATEIVRGSEHPALRDWKHETTLGTLFAAGVLG